MSQLIQQSKNYFDANATTPPYKNLVLQDKSLFDSFWLNPNSLNHKSKELKQIIWNTKKAVAKSLGLNPLGFVMCSGATEANWLGCAGTLEKLAPGAHIFFDPGDHPSLIQSALYWTSAFELESVTLKRIDREIQIPLANPNTALCISLAHGETGEIRPINQLIKFCDEGGILLLDVSQALGRIPLPIQLIQKAFCITASTHKAHGIKGIGFLDWLDPEDIFNPIQGGGQQFNLRGGTEDALAILKLRNFIALLAQNQKTWLKMEKFKECFLNSDLGDFFHFLNLPSDTLPNTFGLFCPDHHNPEKFVSNLDEIGFQIGLGSACSANKRGPLTSLLYLGFTPEKAKNYLRISCHLGNTKRSVEDLAEQMCELVF